MTIDVLRNSLMLKKKSTDRSIVECIEMRATNFTDDKLSNFFLMGNMIQNSESQDQEE
jgi:uncharacterized protein (DUF2235 family)